MINFLLIKHGQKFKKRPKIFTTESLKKSINIYFFKLRTAVLFSKFPDFVDITDLFKRNTLIYFIKLLSKSFWSSFTSRENPPTFFLEEERTKIFPLAATKKIFHNIVCYFFRRT